jgi:hypothetical protein
MMLKDCILAVENWQTMSTQEILAALQAENIPFQNSDSFTWKGIASVWIPERGRRFGAEGCRMLQNVLEEQGDRWLISQLATGIPIIDEDVQNTFYFLDQSGILPGARHLAREVRRNISILEKSQIKERIEKFHVEIEVPSPEQIDACVSNMKLVALSKIRIEQAQDRIQVYREAWTEYIDNNGLGPEPEL